MEIAVEKLEKIEFKKIKDDNIKQQKNQTNPIKSKQTSNKNVSWIGQIYGEASHFPTIGRQAYHYQYHGRVLQCAAGAHARVLRALRGGPARGQTSQLLGDAQPVHGLWRGQGRF
jgi:hypothetical protein